MWATDLTRDRCVYGRVYLFASSSEQIRGFSHVVFFIHSTEGSPSPAQLHVQAFSHLMPMFANVEGLACSVCLHSAAARAFTQDYGG